MRFSRYLLRNIWRQRLRSGLTLSGTAVAIFVLCIVSALQQGIQALSNAPEAQRTLVVFQQNRFCPQSSRLPVAYVPRIAEIPGVEDAVPIFVWTNNCRASLDAVTMHATTVDALQRWRSLQLVDGSLGSFTRRTNAVLVGRSIAQRFRLAAGDSFSIGTFNLHVAGVFSSTSSAEEGLIYAHLEFLQLAQGEDAVGMATMVEVHLQDGSDAMAIRRAIDHEMAAGPVPTVTRQKNIYQLNSLSDLVDLIWFTQWLGYACAGLILAIVATTALMNVQDRIKEHGILQVLGMRPNQIFRLVLAESLVISLAGGLVGTLVAGAVLGGGRYTIASEGVLIAVDGSWSLAALGVVSALAVGAVAGIVPAIEAARTPIIRALHQA